MMPEVHTSSGLPLQPDAAARLSVSLSELLAGYLVVGDALDCEVQGLCSDSRRLRPNELFLALPGAHANGRDFIDAAIAAGAAAVLADAGEAGLLHFHSGATPVFHIEALAQQAGLIADRFYGQPSRDLNVMAVTGTNGKTSVAHFLAQALSAESAVPCGLIGTLGNGLYGQLQAGTHTTPDALSLQALLADLRAAGAKNAVMEASSHGLEQGRVNGVAISTALFTNLSRDHLDYHGDMTRYADAKRRLFHMLGLRHVVINADDAFGRELLASLPDTVQACAYGLTAAVDPAQGVLGRDLSLGSTGLEMTVDSPWGSGRLRSSLLGRFNASNLLAALAGLLVNGMALPNALLRLSAAASPAGRMERFTAPGRALVVVDYAHTPDALTQALQAVREHLPAGAELWCVFGCGGDRDRGKRPLMGTAAEQFADRIILTDDNPRTENPLTIIDAIRAGLQQPEAACIQQPRDRAIAFALQQARPGDVVLVAGKGHEDYQETGAARLPFSDRQQVQALLLGGAS